MVPLVLMVIFPVFEALTFICYFALYLPLTLHTYSHVAAFKFVTLRVKLGYDHHAGTCVHGKLENRKVPGLLVSFSQFVFLRTRKSATGANIGHQEFFLFCLLFLDY